MADMHTKINLDDVENIRHIVVDPVVCTLEEKLKRAEQACVNRDQNRMQDHKTLSDTVTTLLARVESLESDRRKAMLGYSAAAAAAAAIVTVFIEKLKIFFTGK